MPQNVLVTGGAGFIGSHACEALLEQEKHVICVDNFNDYYDPHVKEENIKELSNHKHFTLYRSDVTDLKGMSSIFTEHAVDAIMHIAARAGVRPSIENPVLCVKTNVEGTLNMLELARQFSIKKFIFASSSSIYGLGKVPFEEDANVYDPISPYAATKVSGELLCRAYHHLYSMPIVCLRLFTVYGPRGRPDMAPYKFMKLIMEGKEVPFFGDGDSQRDYTYVGDIVKGFLAALEKNISFDIINLGNSKPEKLSALIHTLEEYTGKKAKIKHLPAQPGDVPVTYADISKAKRILGWQPETSFDEGVKSMVRWYREASAL
jgi:UDP-glucuronate 4-epimerase